ncbi:hypothetical protein [Deinococcus yunweiensis]|uniref:hypothetical protein n=1 Tax=Deinococcus yunweiensis TaxID=367282 RepID=UPI00398ECC79
MADRYPHVPVRITEAQLSVVAAVLTAAESGAMIEVTDGSAPGWRRWTGTAFVAVPSLTGANTWSGGNTWTGASTWANRATFALAGTGRKTTVMMTSGLLLGRISDLTQNVIYDYQDELALAAVTPGRTVTITANGTPITGISLEYPFRDDSTAVSLAAGGTPYPLIVEIDCTGNPIIAASNGTYRMGSTFRGTERPTGIKVENWDGTAYVTVQDATVLAAADYETGFYLGDNWLASAANAYAIQKLRVTISGTNPNAGILYLQRLMLYHGTATWDPWRLHRLGGTMFGDVNWVLGAVKVNGQSIAERQVIDGQSGGTIGRVVRRSSTASTWVHAEPTDPAAQLGNAGVRVSATQVITRGLASGLSGLTIGAAYFLAAGGTLTSADPGAGGLRVGVAHSATELDVAPSITPAPAGAAGAGGSAGQVQYNNGTLAGAAKVTVGTSGSLELLTDTLPTPPAGELGFGAREYAGRISPAWIMPSGELRTAQPSLARTRTGLFNPAGNSATLPPIFGLPAPTVVGTATSRAVATTSMATRMRRLGFVTAATTAGSMVEVRWPAQQFSAGSGAIDGSGFFLVLRIVPSDAATVAGARTFLGVQAGTAAATNVEPNTLLNAIGLAQLSTDATQWYLIASGSAAQAAQPLGTALGAPGTLSADAYQLVIYAPASPANTFYVRARNLRTGVESNTITLTGGATVLPQAATLLAPKIWRTNNGTALAAAFDIALLYVETEF